MRRVIGLDTEGIAGQSTQTSVQAGRAGRDPPAEGAWELLPFSKKKNQSDEVELDEDDFEVVEVSSTPKTVQRAVARPRTIVPVSRRILAEEVEEDVAGQCLASIAAETSQTWRIEVDSSSSIIAVAASPLTRPIDEPTTPSSISRLPAVSAPPLSRAGAAHVPGVRESTPPPAFVRRSSPKLPAIPAAAPSSYVAVASAVSGEESASEKSSVAPVAMPVSQMAHGAQRAEPTIIVVRERPRVAWIFAAAAIGALASFGATRLMSTSSAPLASTAPPSTEVAPAAAGAAVAPIAPIAAGPSTAVVAPQAPQAPTAPTAPTAPAAPPAPALQSPPALATHAAATSTPPPAIVHFGDDEGVAIKAPAASLPARRPASSAAGAPAAPAATTRSSAPRVPSMGPALPDGSFGLGRSDTSTTSSASAPPPALTASAVASADARKRALTPEQQLAAAQLKASMK